MLEIGSIVGSTRPNGNGGYVAYGSHGEAGGLQAIEHVRAVPANPRWHNPERAQPGS